MPGIVMTPELSSALNHLQAGNHAFITGKAGTGKSTLVRLFMEQTSRNVLVAAPTGMAALNVGGLTLHRLFSFRPGVTEAMVRSPRYSPAAHRDVLERLDVLVIDEASMVRADLFDAVAAALELYGPRPGERFGGVQLVLVGDVYQLPPVVSPSEQTLFEQDYESPYFFSARHFPEGSFPVFELTHVFRQEHGSRFTELLNGVRDGSLTQRSLAELNERVDPGFSPPADEPWMTLTTTNRMADAANRRELAKLKTAALTSEADTVGDLTGFDPPVPHELELRVGAQVMMVVNDPLDRWVNGTLGEVVDLGWDKDSEPWAAVATPGGDVFIARPHTWEVLSPVALESGRLSNSVQGTFRQLPMRLAWAITIHKAQGQTLDRAIVDIRGGVFSDGQLYVALSRVRSMEGLVLRRTVLPKDIQVAPSLRRFLRSQRAVGDTGGAHGGGADDDGGLAFLSMITVGDAGRGWRPRPLEIAVVTSDGEQASTLVNPGRDLGDAASTYGIDADMLTLAPDAAQALTALGSLLEGRTVVAANADTLRGLIDFELRRLGVMEHMPLFVDIGGEGGVGNRTASAGLTIPANAGALTFARELAHTHHGFTPEDPDPWTAWEHSKSSGYLLTRSATNATDAGTHPSAAVPPTDPLTFVPSDKQLTQGHINHLAARLKGRTLGPATAELKRSIEAENGVVIPYETPQAGPALTDILKPGARIAFTGTITLDGTTWDRAVFARFIEGRGFVSSANVTKTRTDLLVLADVNSESGKAKNARKYGTPMASLADFLAALEQ
ncbi:AAA family ATPase [Pseudoglutamicibacter cumminsii]|uniref:AAA family ATPase n=1 Tax=Pseudoglutamicibacter cumminsii TaxID=156979 RepID=UPI0021A70BC3|nr:AAA family ATPase [Pseudoglutamicibacter cumminsii]MCT1686795.1 AAA family ATPase [Pseudoglutamicibacter cumminsii]